VHGGWFNCCGRFPALQLCDGASVEEKQRWFLRPAQEFHYLNQSTCYDIPGDSNAEEYKVCLGAQSSRQRLRCVEGEQVEVRPAVTCTTEGCL
jgi:hypothetical protein